ncbi:LL-diaminopimelate aminotransferase [Congzhengia minquanensis]|uniref:LL-diaminopimelate aminotransferase n=1 Tax=Congzhengia minquanensis TaxID=2763657 RepID=A0A926DP09_9FIRM|nr:LL-diaminopimelate aminotransferase [Congzhengia minquanensis]MBC8541197.1 LL-diaminopimelate aminotransferase [Congzhengia minquanensis]
MNLNTNYKNLQQSYLFSTIGKKVADFQKTNPALPIIKLGIGDVTRPLCPAVVNAMKKACDEMGKAESFRGYGPEQGYGFLKEAILNYYKEKGVSLELDEIFVSDGAKSDVGNILDLFDKDNTVLVPDPVYPVYVDTNIMDGRNIVYMNANEENGFLPMPDEAVKAGLIYLCSPNNPTGAVYTKDQLKAWVDYAIDNHAIILFDAAYEAFVRDSSLPRSIFEIEGAKKCAIEFCSFSKTAGFTGTRCGYTVVPLELESDGLSLNKMWLRRQTTKFNGVNYIVQRGAEAVFSPEGRKQIQENIDGYMENAKVIVATMKKLGIFYTGGENSPYIWLKCPEGMKSWDFFDYLLTKLSINGTPGAGFGENGEGFFRLTAFGDPEQTKEAMRRLENADIYKK